jgi:hypothetical protein
MAARRRGEGDAGGPAPRLALALGVALVLAAPGCGGSTATPADGGLDGLPPVDWEIALDPGRSAPISRALLGHYDLSGALFAYDAVPGLAAAMDEAGFAEWRVGVGRWELATQLLPTLTDGTPCDFPLPQAFAPPGSTDLTLMAARDWFVDDGQAVTLADTAVDDRYALGYVRRVLDTATALGARPYLSVDLMPRALAENRAPERSTALLADACTASFTNRVSNSPPADPAVFAAAVTGLVRRLVEGSGGEAGRPIDHVEVWNEPELPYFWDVGLDPDRQQFFAAAAATLVQLDAYRRASSRPEVQALRFGFGSFARSATAAAVITSLDENPIAGYGRVPLDFVSFHAYANDPEAILAAIEEVAAAAAASTGYRDLELVLSEWGPDLEATAGDVAYAWSSEPPLLMATVIAWGAAAGLGRAHHAIFWDYYPWSAITWGLYDHDLQPKPLASAYRLLARLLPDGAVRLVPAGLGDGRLDGGLGAVLATRDAAGVTRVLLVNRGTEWRLARVSLAGARLTPTAVTAFFLPDGEQHGLLEPDALVPARSLLLLEFAAP